MSFASAGNLNMCQVFVNSGAQVDWTDKFGCAAVHYARAQHYLEIVEYLDCVKEVVELPQPEEHQISWLCEAVQKGSTGAVDRFTRSNLALHRDDEGGAEVALHKIISSRVGFGIGEQTPLHLAVSCSFKRGEFGAPDRFYRSDFQVARALLLARADPFAVAAKKDTPLHHAAHSGDLDHYEALLGVYEELYDADEVARLETKLVNSDDFTPRDIALRSKMRMGMLARHGEEETVTLARAGFLAFTINLFETRLERVREAQLQTWWDVLRGLKGNLPSRDDLQKWAAIVEMESPTVSNSKLKWTWASPRSRTTPWLEPQRRDPERRLTT